MSEIDPWTLPLGRQAPGAVGLPDAPSSTTRSTAPLMSATPQRVVVGLGLLYVLLSIVEIFLLNHEVTLAGQLDTQITGGQFISSGQTGQLYNDDALVSRTSWIAVLILAGALVAIGIWQRDLSDSLGSVGARRAVFKRAGYPFFRAAWILSIVITVLIQATTTGNGVTDYTLHDIVGRGHDYMLYRAVQAVVGAVLVYYAIRLRRISEEGVARVSGTYGSDR